MTLQETNSLINKFANKLIQDKSHPLSLRSVGGRVNYGPMEGLVKISNNQRVVSSETSFPVRRLRPALYKVEQLKKGVPGSALSQGECFNTKFKGQGSTRGQ